MLRTILFLLLFALSFNALACLKVVGTFAVDGESWKMNQKIDHNKEYIFPMGTFILKLKVKPGKEKAHDLFYTAHEKKGIDLILVTNGEEKIKEDATREIFAKGEKGQPNSIITIKLTNI